jgi:hypothetical protein
VRVSSLVPMRIIALVTLVLAACTDAGNGSSTTSTTSPSPSPSPLATPSPTPSPTPKGPMELGERGITPRGHRVVVLAWDRNVNRPIEPKPGRQFGRLVIKFCYTGEPGGPAPYSLPNSPGQFQMIELAHSFLLVIRRGHLLGPDGKSYQPELAANNRALRPGECVRGYIVYDVPAGRRPIQVGFTGSFGFTVIGTPKGGPLIWRI